MRARRAWMLLVLAVLLLPVAAQAETTDFAALIDGELSRLDLSGWQQAADSAAEEGREAFGVEDVETLIRELAAGEGADMEGMLGEVTSLVGESLASRLALVASMAAICLISGLTAQMREGGASGIAGFVLTAVVMLMACGPLRRRRQT